MRSGNRGRTPAGEGPALGDGRDGIFDRMNRIYGIWEWTVMDIMDEVDALRG